jgi:DNA polymerase-1
VENIVQALARICVMDAAVRVRKRIGAQLHLQVHDELVFAVAPGDLEALKQLTITAMRDVAQLSVPLEVHIGIGANWELAGH